MRVHVRVSPGAARTEVGGRYGEDDPPVLLVRVTAPATDGRIDALAEAFGVRRRAVSLAAGAGSRRKTVEVEGATPDALAQLLGASM
jgi:uncharacterized protein YggU (UPF0235/DUF167 family)